MSKFKNHDSITKEAQGTSMDKASALSGDKVNVQGKSNDTLNEPNAIDYGVAATEDELNFNYFLFSKNIILRRLSYDNVEHEHATENFNSHRIGVLDYDSMLKKDNALRIPGIPEDKDLFRKRGYFGGMWITKAALEQMKKENPKRTFKVAHTLGNMAFVAENTHNFSVYVSDYIPGEENLQLCCMVLRGVTQDGFNFDRFRKPAELDSSAKLQRNNYAAKTMLDSYQLEKQLEGITEKNVEQARKDFEKARKIQFEKGVVRDPETGIIDSFVPLESQSGENPFDLFMQAFSDGKGIIKHYLDLARSHNDELYDNAFAYEVPLLSAPCAHIDFGTETATAAAGLLNQRMNKTWFKESVYNFYAESYEEFIKEEFINIPEFLLPNAYILRAFYEALSSGKKMNSFLKKGQLVDLEENLGKDQHGLFDAWAFELKKALADKKVRKNLILSLNASDSDLLMSSKVIFTREFIKKHNFSFSMEELFPYFLKLEFDTVKTSFAEFLSANSSFTHALMLDLVWGTGFETNLPTKSRFKLLTDSSVFSHKKNIFMEKEAGIAELRVPSLDFAKWIRRFIERGPTTHEDLRGGVVVLTEEQESKEIFYSKSNQELSPSEALMKLIDIKKTADRFDLMIKNKTRSFKDILEGKLSYSEAVFYSIEKRAASGIAASVENKNPNDKLQKTVQELSLKTATKKKGSLIQEFFIPNLNDVDKIEFIDTQLVNDKKYEYYVNEWRLVFGTKYNYEMFSSSDSFLKFKGTDPATKDIFHGDAKDGDLFYMFMVRTEPHVTLEKVPFFSFNNTISDLSPMAPDMHIVPYKKENNVLIILNPMGGTRREVPIEVESDDKQRFYYASGGETYDASKPILFSSDDDIKHYTIYRLDKKPEKLIDFAEGKKYTIDAAALGAQSVSLKDTISENKKYYYIARALDVHGRISNPTRSIYEVEIVNNNGVRYPIFRTFVLDKERKISPGIASKSGRKLIFIKPKQEQVVLEESDYIDNDFKSAIGIKPILGRHEDKSVFDGERRFKIRLTSKKSGKKLDFNIKFKHEHITTIHESSTSKNASKAIKHAVKNT